MIQSKGVKNLSATSIKKIRRMIAAVVAEPEFYDQGTYGENRCIDEGAEVCGTVCCAAGWAVWLDNKPLYDREMKKEVKTSGWGTGFNWSIAALKALDLNTYDVDDDIDRLFGHASSWPYPFYEQYSAATTPQQRAKVFAKRWEHFLKTDGRE